VLRRPFPPNLIGKLPKPTRRDAQKGKCPECGGWHGLPAVHLDYVGHAAVTDRLLEADPTWTWHPYAVDEQGLPRITVNKNGDAVLWIVLRVGGHERIGVGTVPAGTFEMEKQLISDAIRSGAMRYGVALDLWSKEDLGHGDEEVEAPKSVDEAAEGAKRRMTARMKAVDAAKRHVLDLADGDKERARVLWSEAVRTLGVIEKAMTVEQAQAAANLVADTMLVDAPVVVTKGEQVPLPDGEEF
jgi:hypothetical protein